MRPEEMEKWEALFVEVPEPLTPMEKTEFIKARTCVVRGMEHEREPAAERFAPPRVPRLGRAVALDLELERRAEAIEQRRARVREGGACLVLLWVGLAHEADRAAARQLRGAAHRAR